MTHNEANFPSFDFTPRGILLPLAVACNLSRPLRQTAAKIGPRRTKAIIESIKAYTSEMRRKDQRLSDEVYQHTNGPNAYRRLIEQATDVLSQSEVQGYVLQIAKGGSSAQRAIEGLQSRISGEAVSPDRHAHTSQYRQPKPAAQPSKPTGITSKAYLQAMQALHADLTNTYREYLEMAKIKPNNAWTDPAIPTAK